MVMWTVQRRVAVCLWCLAAHLFGIGWSTVCDTVHETCREIVKVLMRDYIKFPCGDDLNHVVDEFKTKWGVPQCFGAVDGCDIPICAPSEQLTDYYN